MFVNVRRTMPYRDPWLLDFDARFAMLRRGSPRAAYYYARPDTSTFRYRAYNIAQSLAAATGRGGASAAWFTEDDVERMPAVLDSCDVLVLCRNSLYNDAVARIAAFARARGRTILFDVDDLVFDLRYAHLVMHTLSVDTRSDEALDKWFAYSSRVAATFELCDGAITTNDYLAGKARAWSRRPVRIIPNYLNREQCEIGSEIWAAKQGNGWRRDGRLHVGYFSGSPSHDHDFRIAAASIAELMDRDPTVHLRIVGFLNLPKEMSRFRRRIEILPLQDFLSLQREIGATEINLVPLQENEFTHCKSELKWFEAAIVGSLTIASPTHAYANAIEHEKTGWLAHAGEWETLLRQVAEDLPAHLAAVGPVARDAALERFGWARQADTISAMLFETW